MTHRPSGWRPTAFYRRDGEVKAMTHAAQLDADGYPLRSVSDVLIGDGILLHGPWMLVRYDEKWGHAEYGRPDGYVEPHENYRLAK